MIVTEKAILFLVSTIGCCLLMLASWLTRKSAIRRTQWPSTEAIVEKIRIVPDDTEDYFEITVRYRVNGAERVTKNDFDLMPCSDEQTKVFMQKHPPGSIITVYYNPDAPDNFYRNPMGDVSTQGWIFIGLCAVGVAFSALGLYASLHP